MVCTTVQRIMLNMLDWLCYIAGISNFLQIFANVWKTFCDIFPSINIPCHVLLSKHNRKPLIVNNMLPFCCDNTSGLLVQFFIIPSKIIKFSLWLNQIENWSRTIKTIVCAILYQSNIVESKLGLRFIMNNFGACSWSKMEKKIMNNYRFVKQNQQITF